MSQSSKPYATRLRDFVTLAAGMVCVLILLWVSGALGLVPALASAVAYLAVMLAYFAGSSPQKLAPETPPENQLPAPLLDPLLRALPLPAFEIDVEGRIAASNQPAAKIIGSNISMHPRARNCIRNVALLQAIETVRTHEDQSTLSLTYSDGPDRVWQAHVAKLGSEGNVLTLLEDLTPQKRAQQARADFLANASHELRTPLSSIAGFVETMRGVARNNHEDWPRFLDIMHGETERMSRLIDDLLSLSRIEFSEHHHPDEIVDLAELARTAMDALRPLAEGRGINLEIRANAEALQVFGAADQIIQIVQNLLENAIKYTEADGQVLLSFGPADSMSEAKSCAVQSWEDAAHMTLLHPPATSPANGKPQGFGAVWLRVEDSGCGIAREHLPRLGERFYRIDESRSGGGQTKSPSGTGLGLAIVKHIMARHLGGFGAESVEGEGSAFGIWMERAGNEGLRRP